MAGTVSVAGLAAMYLRRIRLARTIASRAVCAQSHPPNARATVLVLGDSTGVGVGATTPEDSVAGRIAAAFPDTRVFNYARSGACVHDVLAQLDRHGAQPADMVLIQASANDVVDAKDVSAVEADLRLAIGRAQALGALVALMPGCNFVFAPFFKPFFASSMATRAHRMHAMVQRVAESTGALYVDLFHLKPADPFFREGSRYFCADGLHPSGEGYRIWFEELMRKVPLAEMLALREAA
ncbi:MAG: SGNH/GDSL hydrolase family protein [Usitatibacter sp.]